MAASGSGPRSWFTENVGDVSKMPELFEQGPYHLLVVPLDSEQILRCDECVRVIILGSRYWATDGPDAKAMCNECQVEAARFMAVWDRATRLAGMDRLRGTSS